MHLRQHMSQSLLHLPKQQQHLHTHVALSLRPKHPKLNRAACGVGSLVCSAATQKKKPSQPWATKSQANAASAVMAAVPMAEAAVVVAVAVVVTVPSAVSAQKVKVATSATPKVLKPVASAQRAVNVQSAASAMWNNAVKVVAAKVAAHAKTATAVAVAKAEMVKLVIPKAKPPSTTTLHQKPKPKHAPKHATNAWPVKSAAKAPKAATSNANLALSAANVVSVQNVVKVAKTVANAAHAASAMMVAVNAPHA